MATDRVHRESVKEYAEVEISTRKALLEKRVIKLKEAGMSPERQRR